MKKWLLMALMLCALMPVEAQNTNTAAKKDSVQNNDKGPKIYRRYSVVTLVGYLKIFPHELGVFDYEPTEVISRTNSMEQYGYDTWRIPTNEEITIIKAAGYADPNDKYFTKESRRGRVLLVTDQEKASVLKERRQAAYQAEQRRLSAERERKNRQAEERRAAARKRMVDSIAAQTGYIDLGLPSGMKWKAQAEPKPCSFNMANLLYQGYLPSKNDFQELEENCTWEYVNVEGHRGYIATGKNGRKLFVPDQEYWTNLADEANERRAMRVEPYENKNNFRWVKSFENRSNRYQILLATKLGGEAQNLPFKQSGEFVDLGLPSGTKWAREDKFGAYRCTSYDYSEDVKGVPTKAQWKELRQQCQWVWTGFGFKVIGKNGNYIFLTAENHDGYTSTYSSYSNANETNTVKFAYANGKDVYPVSISQKGKLRFVSNYGYKSTRVCLRMTSK